MCEFFSFVIGKRSFVTPNTPFVIKLIFFTLKTRFFSYFCTITFPN